MEAWHHQKQPRVLTHLQQAKNAIKWTTGEEGTVMKTVEW